jgi:hypothetical protein
MLAFLAAAALLGALPSAASLDRRDPSVLAVDRRSLGKLRLFLADPLTLRPRGTTSVDLAGHGWPYAFDGTRSRAAFGRWPQAPSLRLVDARRLRIVRDVRLGHRRAEIKAVAWLGRQIVVLLEREPRTLVLLRVDPEVGRVVSAVGLGRWSAEAAATQSRFVVLLAPRERIASARLVVVSPERIRTVELERVSAGSLPGSRGKPSTVIQPGLAVSPREPRAWVVGAAEAAEVDLETLAVRYRGKERHPSATLKEPVVGSARDVQWLSPGRLVVAGWDATRKDGGRIVFEPTGIRLLDTASWSDRTIHARAQLVYVRPPRLLTIAPGEGCTTLALTAYTLSGAELYRVCEQRATGEVLFAGRYARLGRVDGRVAVVDLTTGAVAARARDVRVTAVEAEPLR